MVLRSEGLFVLPTPQKVRMHSGGLRFAQGGTLHVRLSVQSALRVADIRETLRPVLSSGVSLQIHRDLEGSFRRLSVSSSFGARIPWGRAVGSGGRESYRLRIDSGFVALESGDEPGLFYALMTLRQILRNHASAPCCTIEDWPVLAVRGIHMDLKGCTPTPDYMRRIIRNLSEYKINALLMEYEDAIQLESLPGVSKPSAWSRADMEAIAGTARECHIRLIPLVQSLGHAEYILRRESYASLRETPDNIQQFCPSKPETFALWRDMADEILDLFPETPYFHVGADETRQLGECRICAGRLRRGEDALDLYLEHMNKVWGHVLAGGRTPIFWDDIVSRHFTPARCRRIPQGVAVMVWLYFMGDDRVSTIRVNERNYAEREILRHDRLRTPVFRENTANAWLDEMPAAVRRRYEKYMHRPAGARGLHPAPFIEMFAERGYEVLGASAVRVSGQSIGLPDLVARIDNIRQWGRTMGEAGQRGVISTSWSRAGSTARPQVTNEALWYPMCASAQWYWSPDGADVGGFQSLFDRDFFGVEDGGWLSQVFEAVSQGGPPVAMRELEGLKVRRNRDVFESMQLAGRIHGFYKGIIGNAPVYFMSYYAREAAFHEKLNGSRRNMRGNVEGLLGLKERARADYGKTMLGEEAEELVRSQFEFFERVDMGL